MASAFSVVILGHSFIRRLKDFVNSDNDFHNLRLNKNEFNIQMRGIGGLTMRRLVCAPELYRFENTPHICFIEMGTNDLCDARKSVSSIFHDITSFGEFLLANSVKFVIIGQVLMRDRRQTEFNMRVIELNNRLHEFCATHPEMKFWHHRGFSRTQYLARDGVHPQDPRQNSQPMRKYMQSIRNALIHVSGHMRKPQTKISYKIYVNYGFYEKLIVIQFIGLTALAYLNLIYTRPYI
jgi:hypothetical protein